MLGELFEHLLKFFGLYLYRGSSGRKHGYKKCHVFCMMTIVAGVDLAILSNIIYDYILHKDISYVFKNLKVQLYSNRLECSCTIIFFTVCVYRMILVQNKLFQIRALLDKVERNLQIKSLGIMNKTQAFFLILFYTLWIFLSLFEVSIKVKKYGMFPLIHLFKHYAQMYLSLCALTFVLLVFPIFKLFQLLNNKLNNILKQNNKRKTAHQRESMLDTLSDSHWDLYEAMSKLDEAFGLQLLLIVSYVYIKCITNLYRFFALIYFHQVKLYNNLFLAYFCWIIMYFSIAVVIFKACTDSTVEARKTNVLIWDNVIQHHNLSLAEKLKTFSTKMSHNNYKFTGYGFFVLELSTLSSMLLSVTAQLVILFSIVREN